MAASTSGPARRLYNSAVLIEPKTAPRVYRKLHLWDQENRYFEPGNVGIPVFTTRPAKIAMLICYDCWFPEAIRSCALQGADIVCIPTNWVPIPGQVPDKQAMANVLVQAAAHSNSIYIAAADRIGIERGQKFIGQSLIVSYTGWPVAGPAGKPARHSSSPTCPSRPRRRRGRGASSTTSSATGVRTSTPRLRPPLRSPDPVSAVRSPRHFATSERHMSSASIGSRSGVLRTWRWAAALAASAFRG